MKKTGKKILSYLLVLTMLMSMYTPVFGAEPSEATGADAQKIEENVQDKSLEDDSSAEEEKNKPEDDQVSAQPEKNKEHEILNDGNEEETSDSGGETEDKEENQEINQEKDINDGVSEGEKEETLSMVCNYIFTQENDSLQSVIVEVGDQNSTVLESAEITYKDGDGELKIAAAEEVVQNVAAFLMELPGQEQNREFISMKAVAGGQEYNVSGPE